MNDFRKRRNLKREILRMIIGCIGIAALGLVAFVATRAAWDMYGKFAAASQARSDAEAQLSELQTQYEQVETQVKALNTERGVEAAVRERYGVAKPGEGEIDVVQAASSTTPTPSKQESWFAKFLSSLFVW